MIPKSLHTVTVLVNVAREILLRGDYGNTSPLRCMLAVDKARRILGYADTPDVYSLAARAVVILEKEAAK
jgi:hypothetical protein